MEEIEKRFSKLLKHDDFNLQNSGASSSAASVLILLVNEDGQWKIVYTRRTTSVRTHQGEVSFPGGAFETEDSDMVQTALRETYEEIGVKPDCVKIIGNLDPIRTISNFMVYPYVGIMECVPEFEINKDEVERVFMIPLSWLENKDNFFEQDHQLENRLVRRVVHYKNFEGEHLWGLTARITQLLLGLG